MAKIKSDIEIARASKIKPISDILKKYNIPDNHSTFSPMGRHIAKLNFEYIFIICQIIGLSPMSTIGLGISSEYLPSLVPHPPANITTFIKYVIYDFYLIIMYFS